MRDRIKMKYRFDAKQLNGATIHQLYFYDDITAKGRFNWATWEYKESETSAKYIRDQLAEIPSNEDIEVHINSRGGEVGEGVAIYNLLKQKALAGNKIVCYVDGYCYSVAVDIAMAADEIHMGLGTSMFVHFPWSYCAGNSDELRAIADSLDALGDAAVQLYMHRAKNITEEELRAMMKKETTLTPDQCLEYGFCDIVDTYEAVKPEPEDGNDDQADDDPDQVVTQLRQQLAARKEFMAMLQTLKPITSEPANNPPVPEVNMRNTFLKALRGI